MIGNVTPNEAANFSKLTSEFRSCNKYINIHTRQPKSWETDPVGKLIAGESQNHESLSGVALIQRSQLEHVERGDLAVD